MIYLCMIYLLVYYTSIHVSTHYLFHLLVQRSQSGVNDIFSTIITFVAIISTSPQYRHCFVVNTPKRQVLIALRFCVNSLLFVEFYFCGIRRLTRQRIQGQLITDALFASHLCMLQEYQRCAIGTYVSECIFHQSIWLIMLEV